MFLLGAVESDPTSDTDPFFTTPAGKDYPMSK